MNSVIAWFVAFMMTMASPTRPQFTPAAKETPTEATIRYESIATDIATVLWKNPPLYAGDMGRLKTASIIMGIMLHESSFRKDVDLNLGDFGRGDHGRSWCMMQIQIGNGRTPAWNTVKQRAALPGDSKDEIVQGWTGPELISDRKKCIEAGYRMMKESFETCRSLPPNEWLRGYASGNCTDGVLESEHRMNVGMNWFNAHRPGFNDVQALQILQGQLQVAESVQEVL